MKMIMVDTVDHEFLLEEDNSPSSFSFKLFVERDLPEDSVVVTVSAAAAGVVTAISLFVDVGGLVLNAT